MALISAALAWAGGLLLGRWLGPQVAHGNMPLAGAVLLGLLLSLLLVGRCFEPGSSARRHLLLGGLFLVAGGARLPLALPRGTPDEIAFHTSQGPVVLQALVAEEPVPTGRQQELLLQARRLVDRDPSQGVRGLVQARVSGAGPLHYGDLVEVHGRLAPLPYADSPSYTDYLLARGIHAQLQAEAIQVLARGQGSLWKHVLLRVREAVQSAVRRILPEPQAGLLLGVLLGQKRALPQSVMDRFNATGLSHIVVVSGWNITVVAALLARLFGPWLGRRRATLASLLGVAAYVLLVGLEPPVVRAGITGSLTLVALLLGRTAFALTSLAAAGMAMTAWQPFLLWDASFQLSFAATVGLIFLAAPLEQGVSSWLSQRLPEDRSRRVLGWLKEPLLVSLAAQVMVLPLLLHYFGRLPLIAPLTNLLVLPAQPLLMAWGAAAAAAGMVWLPLGQVVGAVAWLFLTWTLGVADVLARLPYASLEVAPWGWGGVVAYYLALAAGFWFLRTEPEARRERLARLWSALREGAGLLGVAMVLALVAAAALVHLPDGRLHVWFLDVGQGDAILMQSPGGRQVLVDGGPDPMVLLPALSKAMPFWDRSLDLVVLTHPDGDHVSGLTDVPGRYAIAQVLETALPHDEPSARQWQEEVQGAGIPILLAERGMVLDLGDGVLLEVLHPPPSWRPAKAGDDNNGSIVLRVTHGGVSFLLTGDLERAGEAELLRQGLPLGSTVLKVAHHGSGRGSTEPFLEAVRPQLAVVSVGAGNRFGHPADAVLTRLESLGVPVLRTDLQGSVEVITDGRGVWYRTAR